MQIFIETERWLMREIVESDEQALFELDSDPEVHKYIGNHPMTTLEESAKAIQHIRTQYQENGIGRWAVIDRATNELIGWSGLKWEKYIRENLHYYDVGYRFKKKCWGKGIATETAIASVDYGFSKLNYELICGAAHFENIGSNRVLTKAGLSLIETFEFEGATHNWYQVKKTDWLKNR